MMNSRSFYTYPFSAKTFAWLLPIGFLLFISSCDTPEKVLKSNDENYKEAKAREWYKKKEYFKCIPVLEELIGVRKGRVNIEDLYYMYCMANYYQGDYLISSYHFKNFYDQYPNSDKAEECLYMYAKSYQMMSPKPDLDQTYTLKALEAYQYFFSMFPDSKYNKQCNEDVATMHRKLELKALNSAELYYRTSNYRAAATCYENLLRDYPDIAENEKIGFMIIKSNYLYAENSIPQKKQERFKRVILSFSDFSYKYPASKYLADAKKYETDAHYQAARGAFEWAEVCSLQERDKAYQAAFSESKAQTPYITDENRKKELSSLTEKGYFLIIKGYYGLSEEKKDNEKLSLLEKSVKSYYNFVDLFPKSKYSKEAERTFNTIQQQIKKLKDGQTEKSENNANKPDTGNPKSSGNRKKNG